MADIFISYARPDRDRIEKLAAVLEGEGYSVWWDQNIEAGAEFSKDIERELNVAKAVIVCWSKAANQSAWVKDEASVAHEQGKLIPRVDRARDGGTKSLLSPFDELAGDKELIRYLDRYAGFYAIRLAYVNELQSELTALREQTIAAMAEKEQS